jgi:guanylate kinase
MSIIKKTTRKTAAGRVKGSLFIVSAPSGAGKTTLCKELCRTVPGIKHSVSYTTRIRRKGERNNIHYFFVSQEKFKSMINKKEFAEWAMVHGNLYGTAKKHLEETIIKGYDIILDIDVNGAAQMRRVYKDASYIFILPPSMKALEKRLSGRKSDADDEIYRRLNNARDEISYYQYYDYIIINDRIEKALSDLASIVKTSRLKTERLNSGVLENLR